VVKAITKITPLLKHSSKPARLNRSGGVLGKHDGQLKW